MVRDTPQFQCPACLAQFAKTDHLTRHQLSHGNERAHTCQFCSLSFNRRDALLRHWRTCQDRLKSGLRPPVLPLKKRGRKLNACTRCAQLKKKCSGALPCVTCAEQNQQCSYARPSTIKTTTCREKEDEIAVPPVLPIEQDLNNHEVQSSEMTMPDAEFLWADLMNGKMSDLWPLSPPPIPWTDLINYPTQVGYPTTPLLGQEKFSDISSGMVDDHTSMFNYRLNGSSSSPVCPSLAPKPNLLRLDIRFLANFTSTHGMANSFEIGNCLARRRVMSNLAQNRNMLSMTRSYGKGSGNAGVADLWLGSSRGVGQSSSGNNRYDWHFASQQPDIPDNVSSLSRRGGDGHPLASKSREIIRGIQETTCSKMPYRTTTINWSQSAERSCARFFSPLNLEKFTRAFWHFWNPNWPVFHRPTFEASQKPAQLIAALSLVGACVSPEKIDRDQAMSWLEAVEDWVFSDPDFSEDMIPQTDDESQLSQIGTRLDSIRAAYALLIIMTWEGNEKQMTRARRTQFTQTVSVSRSLYFFCTAQDAAYDESSADSRSQWMLYALREECIRTLIYVFLLDCAFVMFNNSAPRMVISELQFSLTSPEVWFHAPNPHNWLGCVQKSPRVDEGMSLSEAVGRMMHSDLDATECKIFQQTNLLNHFAITSAFHNFIFHHHYGVDGGSKSLPLSRGLRNWIRVWSNRSPAAAENNEQFEQAVGERVGFYRYTREYWCLAVILYSQFDNNRGLDVNSNLGAGRRQGRIARAFDDSDMGQIHELIVRFREIDLREVLAE